MALDLNQLLALRQQMQFGGVDPLSYTTARNYNAANYNNEARYGDIIRQLTGLYDRNMGRITSLGDQERADINRRADQNKSAALADAVNRGYGASTVRNSLANKAEEDRNRALAQFRDQEIMRQIATDASLAQNVTGLMERRNDQQPDMGNLINTNTALGASGMGYPMYGGFNSSTAPGAGSPQMVGRAPKYDPYAAYRPGAGGGYTSSTAPGAGMPQGYTSSTAPGAGMPQYTPSYPLPGGGSTTPLMQPTSLYGNAGGNGYPAGRTMKGGVSAALDDALMRELRASRQQPRMTSNNAPKPMIRTAGDLGGSLPTYNKAPWQNQDISFGGPSVGGAYVLPGMPVPLGSYEARSMEMYNYPNPQQMQQQPQMQMPQQAPGMTRPPRGNRPANVGVQVQRPVMQPRRMPNGISQYSSPAASWAGWPTY